GERCSPGSWLMRGAERPRLAGLGPSSDAAYLWHFPIFFLLGGLSMSGEVRPLKTVLAAWAAPLTVAFASYVIVERPALAVKRRYSAESAIDRGALLTHVRPSTLYHPAPP